MFSFVPSQEQLTSARAILEENGQDVNQFSGVPLFFARTRVDNRVMTLEQGDQQVVPFFFAQEDLQATVERLQTQQPDLASLFQIEVVSLEVLLESLRTNEDQFFDLVQLIPASETVEFIRDL